ncbi:MAG: hypothetical protein AAGJ18_19595 [Bacteroidota bacterium]
MKSKLFLYLLVLFSLFSCDKNEAIYLQPTAYDGVDKELWPYFAKFEYEAEQRGVLIDLRALGIQGVLEEINTEGIVGLCNHRASNSKMVILDVAFWERASNYRKEMIVFHELGHCVLERGHTDERLANGMCKSIMRSGFGACLTMYNDDDHQDYYLDELFEE